jgi:tetratricopeptide (TPR) repeat protein
MQLVILLVEILRLKGRSAMKSIARSISNRSAILFFICLVAITARSACQATASTERTPTLQDIREAEARFDQKADSVEKIIEILAGAGIFYGLIATVGSYISVKNARADAKADADRAKRELDALQKDIASAIPIMSDLNQSLNALLVQLRGRIPNRWHDTSEKIPPQILQQIKYDEMTVAGLNLYLADNQSSLRPKLSELHQGLGRFYGARYRQESPRNSELADKAHFYFTKALIIDPENYTSYRDRAALATMVSPDSPVTWDDASVDYLACLQGKPGDARSLFGISWCYFKMGRLNHAVMELTELVDSASKLNVDDTIYVLPYAYLNRATFAFKRDGKKASSFIVSDCQAALKQAAAKRAVAPLRYDDFQTDLRACLTGDFQGIVDTLPDDLQKVVDNQL